MVLNDWKYAALSAILTSGDVRRQNLLDISPPELRDTLAHLV